MDPRRNNLPQCLDKHPSDSTPYTNETPSSSSAFFPVSSRSNMLSSSPLADLHARDVSRGLPSPRTPSVASTRLSTSRTSASRSGTRPSTAPGRKSRTTTTSSILGAGEQQNIACALAESCGVTPSVGVAFVNMSRGSHPLPDMRQSILRQNHPQAPDALTLQNHLPLLGLSAQQSQHFVQSCSGARPGSALRRPWPLSLVRTHRHRLHP